MRTLAASLVLAAVCRAQTPEVALMLGDLIRADTSNPPGLTDSVSRYLDAKLKPLGIATEIIQTPVAGKTHFIARLKGDGSKRPVLIAAHSDVVGVEREKWTVDPFAGLIRDGYVWGRGAIDFKGGLAVFTQAVMEIARARTPLARDIILLAEADEEGSGPHSTTWLANNHWDKINCEFALNEGGWIIRDPAGKVLYVSISTNDKVSVTLTLTARGTSTHSSLPRPDNAIYTLARALARLSEYDTKPRLTDSTRRFFRALGDVSPEPMRTHFRNLADGRDEKLVDAASKAISENTLLHAIMRNTIAPVMLNAGFRGNVIPGSAEATVNFRIIPGTTPEELITEVSRVVNDPRVDVRWTPTMSMRNPTPEQVREQEAADRRRMSQPESAPAGILYDSLVGASREVYPGALVTPYLFQAGTDSYPWRSRGVPVYGIYPYAINADDLTRMHGNDERVPVDSLVAGVELMKRTLLKVAAR